MTPQESPTTPIAPRRKLQIQLDGSRCTVAFPAYLDGYWALI